MTGDDEATFRRDALAMITSGPPSAGDDLLGMEIDFVAYLSGLDEIEPDSVEVSRTSHPESLIRASCSAAAGTDLSVAAEAVQTAWTDQLRYQYRESHHLRLTPEGAELAFATQIGPEALYVTGFVIVSPAAP